MNALFTLDDARLPALLSDGDLEVEGRIAGASNSTLRCRIDVPGHGDLLCVYKPVAGERPLSEPGLSAVPARLGGAGGAATSSSLGMRNLLWQCGQSPNLPRKLDGPFSL